jgi:hypothetical protein
MTEIGPYSIHNDDSIIDRVAEDRQHRCDEECIDLELREKVRSHNIETKCDHDIMSERDPCHNSKWPRCHTSDRSTKRILDIE